MARVGFARLRFSSLAAMTSSSGGFCVYSGKPPDLVGFAVVCAILRRDSF